ncbi:SLC13 family permease [Lacrimispora sp.]|uniref:SLC13 family permease n=1 Tax=Lacrimispora sp. TaxID=2719234 RepID=UPI00399246C1
MKFNKQIIGFFSGIIVLIVALLLPLHGLAWEGQVFLGLTLMTVVWWATQVAQSGYVGGFYIVSLCLLKLADTKVIFASWTGSTLWLVIGAYMIATAVKRSGLGERISYMYILRFVKSWKSIIIGIFVLTLILSLLIPNPWSRAFLIMSVMSVIIKAAGMPKEDAVKVGFTVFAASVPVSLIFMTGDSIINPLVISYSTESINFVRWFVIMGPPAIFLSIMNILLILILFKPTKEINMNFEEVKKAQSDLGKMSEKEIRTMIWILIAIVLWITNGITGLDIGWVTLAVAMCLSLPVIGNVLTAKEWGEVPVHVLVFLTAAMAIGKVGAETGLNNWLAVTLLPGELPGNIFILAIFIAIIAIVIHMFIGSVIAAMGVAVPAVLVCTNALGINPFVIAAIIYLAVYTHYVMPFHHLNILVGQGEENGMYTQKEALKMGIPLLVPVLLTVIFGVLWFSVLGLV